MADTKPVYNKSIGNIPPRMTPPSNIARPEDFTSQNLGSQTVPTADYSAKDLRSGQTFTSNQPGMPLEDTPQEDRRKQPQGGSVTGIAKNMLPESLTTQFVATVVVIAAFIDILEFVTVGILGFFTMPLAGLFFYLMFKLKGIDMTKRSRIAIMVGGPLINVIPFISAIPGGWTAQVLTLIATTKIQEKITS